MNEPYPTKEPCGPASYQRIFRDVEGKGQKDSQMMEIDEKDCRGFPTVDPSQIPQQNRKRNAKYMQEDSDPGNGCSRWWLVLGSSFRKSFEKIQKRIDGNSIDRKYFFSILQNPFVEPFSLFPSIDMPSNLHAQQC